MKKLIRLFPFLILIASIGFFSSCKYSEYTQKREQAQTDQKKKAKERQSQRAYRAAFKSHLNRQDKATKKRIKGRINQQKKQSKKGNARRKSGQNCPA